MKIEFENNTIEFNVQYGIRKKISIHIDSTGFITVKAPNDTSKEMIMSVVKHHGKTILEKLQLIAKARETPKTREYQDNGKFLHLGKYVFLHELIETNELNEEELKINLKKFYFSSCKKIIGERIKIYQTQLKVKPKTIEIDESKTKWGSCSSDKKITFNYRLAMAPIEVIDYVIIHELCHLLHMNHDRSFWRRVGSIMPDYKEKEAYLARHGHAMTL
ncbi:M48 family metallopeptidase [Paenibacillus frigoriresistens]|uniref:M48 family metallopeptidase n=1 Tax=Paenibacillus alginolyticus TaxID=59839 RepID=UPI0015677132|nr:SprT family zinc-dependent metalloprotease [Paenibacillus frigoriresistens]NRF94226.1 M48 family metallopeptidase [Paenibacillus frigoriresistens]